MQSVDSMPFGDVRIPRSFWARVVREEKCWIWHGARSGSYGAVSGTSAHRVIARVGRNLRGLVVHHTCENPLCVCPEHLQIMTAREHRAAHCDKPLQPEAAEGRRRPLSCSLPDDLYERAVGAAARAAATSYGGRCSVQDLMRWALRRALDSGEVDACIERSKH